jgi:hypothetical protein
MFFSNPPPEAMIRFLDGILARGIIASADHHQAND